MYDRGWEPEGLTGFARAVEELGVEELWVVEDLGWAGAMSSVGAALAATGRLRLGIGIAPAPLRNPVLLAMELAALARMFPGRVTAGIGHGVAEWMAQVGSAPTSTMARLEETVTAVRGLLRGEEVTLHGREVRLDAVRLVHPPRVVPPVVVGAVGPRTLALSGRIADGTVMDEGHGPEEVAAALAHIGKGRADRTDADRADADRASSGLNVLTFLCVDEDPAALPRALAVQAPWLTGPLDAVHAAAGTAAQAAATVRELWAAGVDTVVLRPLGPEPLAQLAAVHEQLAGG